MNGWNQNKFAVSVKLKIGKKKVYTHYINFNGIFFNEFFMCRCEFDM